MKHRNSYFRLLCFVLGLLMALPLLLACEGDETTPSPDSEAQDTTEAATTDDETQAPAPTAIRDCTIVVSHGSEFTLNNLLTHIQATLKEKQGIDAKIVNDKTEVDENAIEILVGMTNREASGEIFMTKRGWEIRVNEKNVVLTGYNHYDTTCAVLYFLENCIAGTQDGGLFSVEKGYSYSFDGVNTLSAGEFMQYVAVSDVLKPVKEASYEDEGIYVAMQGGGTDGEYFYLLINASDDSYAKILKIDPKTMKVVAQNKNLSLAHANDIAYNPNSGYLMVSWCSKNSAKVSLIDPDTLKIVNEIDTGTKFFAITYNLKRNQYAVAASGGYDIKLLNNNRSFTVAKTIVGRDTGLTKQGFDSDDYYIYYSQTDFEIQKIFTFDWNGKLVRTFTVSMSGEIENIFWYNGNFYSGYNSANGEKNAQQLYRYEFTYPTA